MTALSKAFFAGMVVVVLVLVSSTLPAFDFKSWFMKAPAQNLGEALRKPEPPSRVWTVKDIFPDCPIPNGDIEQAIQSPLLREGIRRALNIPSDVKITPEVAKTLTVLRDEDVYPSGGKWVIIGPAVGVETLEGIQYFCNLRKLEISQTGSQKLDLSPLQGLQNLQSLSFMFVYNVDLAQIQNLPSLSHLQMGNTRGVNFDTAISSLKNLVELSITSGTDVKDIAATVKGLVNLQSLTFYGDDDVWELSTNAPVKDLEFLKSLTKLKTLVLKGLQKPDFSPVAYLPDLRSLELSNNEFSDFSGLANLPNVKSGLRYLNLQHTKITDLKPLKNLTQLETLDISSSQFRSCDPEPIGDLKIPLIPTHDLTGLESFPKLKHLNMNWSCMTGDLKPLISNPNFANGAILDAVETNFNTNGSIFGICNLYYIGAGITSSSGTFSCAPYKTQIKELKSKGVVVNL